MKHNFTSQPQPANRKNSTLQAFLLPVVLITLFLLFLGPNIFAQCTLACNNQINLSISETCNAEVTYDMMLEDANNPGICTPTGSAFFFEVVVMGQNGISVLPTSPFVTDAEVGQLLNVKIRHLASNNLCWGTVLVEDKLAPILTCPADLTVQCTEAMDVAQTGTATAQECSNFSLTFSDAEIDLSCGDPIKQINRTFFAIDQYGYSSSCVQTISIANPDINAVVFPLNFDDVDQPVLACEAVAANASLTEPSNSGYPTLNALPIEEGSNPCGINVGYSDNIIDICDGTYKIVRSWTILEWCTSTIRNDIQIIKVADDDGPVLACQTVINVGTTSSSTCTASVLLPAATVSDLCSGIAQVQIFTQYGTVTGNGGVISNMPIGTHDVTYQATDNCGNSSTCAATVTVSDDDSPTVVCDEFTVVTLNESGIAFVNAQTFDDGSYDNCCLDEFSARRVNAGCDVSNTFGEQVKFCCTDIGTPVEVEMRVTDCFGNANVCNVIATISENSAPEITCPAPVTLLCTDDYDDLSLTGEPTATDACGFANPTSATVANLNNCGSGTVTRTFTVTDNQGSSNTCTQTITLIDNTPWSVNFPADYTAGACTSPDDLDPEDLPAPFNAPTFINDDCEQLAVNVSDEFFQVAPPACFKIIRTWKVIDWCIYDAANPNGPGQLSAEQVIIVMDNEAPEVVCPVDFTVATNAVNCLGTVSFPQLTVTDCSEDIQISISSDLGAGFGPFNNVAPGVYSATYFISDGCGNVTTCATDVTVEENSLPTPYCVGGLTIELSPVDTDGDGQNDNGYVEIWASDFDAGSFDNCGGFVTLSLSPDSADTNAGYTCADVGVNAVNLYVTDEDGNQDFCQTLLFVESVPNVCGSDDFVIAGAISDEYGNMLSNAEVSVNDGITAPNMTDDAGTYHFDDMTAGNDFTVSPELTTLPSNGITTYDLVLIRKHVLTDLMLDSPYKIIGADINNNGAVTTADIVELRKLILTTYTDFPSNTSWRFVDAEYEFANPANPFQDGFPEIYNINNLENDMMTVDFVAIKVGDMNGTASTNGLMDNEGDERTDDALVFQTDDKALEIGEAYTMPIFAQSIEAINSGQFTFAFDSEDIDIQSIEVNSDADFSDYEFATHAVNEGIITAAWYRDAAVQYDAKTPLFYINLVAKNATRLSDIATINSDKTKAIAYTEAGAGLNIALNFIAIPEVIAVATLQQNSPNPFNNTTTITFDLPKGETGTLEITDLSGRVIYSQAGFAAGRNEVRVNGKIFATAGVYFYRLRTGNSVITRKMVKGL